MRQNGVDTGVARQLTCGTEASTLYARSYSTSWHGWGGAFSAVKKGHIRLADVTVRNVREEQPGRGSKGN